MPKDALSLALRDIRRRNFSMAIKNLEQESCRQIYEEDFEYYITLAIACLYSGDIGTASSYFSLARKIRITDSRLLLGQAVIFLRRGDTFRAIQYYLDLKDNNPSKKYVKIADSALEFIKNHGDFNTICRWVDTKKIEQFYPPIGKFWEKYLLFSIPIFTVICGIIFILNFLINKPKINYTRIELSKLELTKEEKKEVKQQDLTNKSIKFIFNEKEITKRYENALQLFQNFRENAAQIEINIIKNSNANDLVKNKILMLQTYFEEPDFSSLKDVPKFSEVTNNKMVFENCWIDWGGKISNLIINEDNSCSLDFIVGNKDLSVFEGSVPVQFSLNPFTEIDSSKYVKILGKIILENDEIKIKGKSVFQSPY